MSGKDAVVAFVAFFFFLGSCIFVFDAPATPSATFSARTDLWTNGDGPAARATDAPTASPSSDSPVFAMAARSGDGPDPHAWLRAATA
jgi:hypothetical protein